MLALEAQRAGVDVVIIPDHYVPIIKKWKAIVILYDLNFVRFPASYAFGLRTKLLLGTWLAERSADHIVTISHQTESDLRRLHGISGSRISVAYPGYDRNLFRPRNIAESQSLLQNSGIRRPYLLYVGNILPHKNLLMLVRAVSLVSGQDLVLVGRDRGYGGVLRAEAERLHVQDRVRLLGYVDDGTKAHLMAQASAFLFPSLHEGFGIPVLEAMASGTPVVVSTDGALRELVGSAGEVVDGTNLERLVNGIRHVLRPEVKRNLRDAGLARASNFDWDESGQKLLAVAHQLTYGNRSKL